MWNLALVSPDSPQTRRNEELARYVRLEYGEKEIGWLLAGIEHEKKAFLAERLPSWLRFRKEDKVRVRRRRGPRARFVVSGRRKFEADRQLEESRRSTIPD